MDDFAPPAAGELSAIYDLLYRLGVTATYTGFFHTSEVAKRYGTSWRCGERNIRSVSVVAWSRSRTVLEELARAPLNAAPGTSRFLAILTHTLSGNSAA